MIKYKNHSEKISKIKSGELSLKENVENYLSLIEKHSYLNAFNFVFEDSFKKAAEIEDRILGNRAGRLAGMVVAVKDVISIKDKPLSCSSKMLSNFTALYDASVIENLLREDAIIIGKTNCDEFAMGSSNENSFFGPVKNPHDQTRVTGGSSGGSAAAVAAGLCDTALGTDTGGSIRQPAAFTGIFGLKPTYGRVSRYGLTAFASSFDSIGPFAANTYDLALLLSVLAGNDDRDATCSNYPIPDYSNELSPEKKYKIGFPEEYFGEGLDPEIRNAIEALIKKLQADGIETVKINLPHNEYSIATYYILTTAEASSNLARYDGARYGYRSENYNDLIEMYSNTRTEGFGNEVKRRIMLGTYVLSAGYYDAYYKKAQQVRRLIKNDFDIVFKEVDLIITPTTPTPAFPIGEKLDDPLQMYLSDIYTTSANLAGIPGINIPLANNDAGLPMGVQFMANQFEEGKLLKMANYIEKTIMNYEL